MKIKINSLLSLLGLLLFQIVSAQDTDINYLKAGIAFESKNYALASSLFKTAVSNEKISQQAQQKYAESLYYLGQKDSAVFYFQKTIDLPNSKADYFIAKILAEKGDAKNSLLHLENYLKQKDKLPENSIRLDASFAGIEQSNEWKQFWITERYNATEKLLSDAAYSLKKEDYIEVLKITDKLIKKNSKIATPYVLRAKAYLKMEDYRNSIKNFDKAIALKNNNADIYNSRGEALFLNGNNKKASADFSKAIELNPYNINFYLSRSKAEKETKQYDQALSDITFYLKYIPTDEKAVFLCGNIHYEKGEYLEALENYNKLSKVSTANSNFYLLRGNSYLKTSTYQNAISDFSAALDLNPNLPEVYINRGLARLGANNKEGACSDWLKARELGNYTVSNYLKKYCGQ